MAGSKVCFSFNDFKDNSSNILQKLRSNSTFSDVTLACDGEQVKAHKVVLSSRSNVFKDLLEQNPHQHPLVYLNGVKYSELVGILDYIYLGEATIAREQLNGFLNAADNLEIEGLTEKTGTPEPSNGDDLLQCITYSPEQINHNNAISKTNEANRNDIENIINNATDLLIKSILNEALVEVSECTINEVIDEICKEEEQKRKMLTNNYLNVDKLQKNVTCTSKTLNREYSMKKPAEAKKYDIENIINNAIELLIKSVLNEVLNEVSEYTISEVIDEVYKDEEKKRKHLIKEFSNTDRFQQCVSYSTRNINNEYSENRNNDANSFVIENIINNAAELLIEYVLNEVYVDISESTINEVINEAFRDKTHRRINPEEVVQSLFSEGNITPDEEYNVSKVDHVNYCFETSLQLNESIENASLVKGLNVSNESTNTDTENKTKGRKIKGEFFGDSVEEHHMEYRNSLSFTQGEAVYISDEEYITPTKNRIEYDNENLYTNDIEFPKISIPHEGNKKYLNTNNSNNILEDIGESVKSSFDKRDLNTNNILDDRKGNYIEVELQRTAYKLNILILEKLPAKQSLEIEGNCAVIIISDKVGGGHIDTNKWSNSSGSHSSAPFKCNTYRCHVTSCSCVKKKWSCDGHCGQFCCQFQKKFNSKLSINVYLNKHNHKNEEKSNSHGYPSDESRIQNDPLRVIWRYNKKDDCYVCTICREAFLLKKQSKEHIKENHFEAIEKCIFCEYCEDYFITMGGYNRHFLKYHTVDESQRNPFFRVAKTKEEPPTCKICRKTFSHKSKVQKHIKSVHEHIKNFQCNICLKLYGNKTSLQKHFYVIHKIESVSKEHVTYLDDETAKEVASKTEVVLKSESTTCHICGKTFARARRIKDHIRTVHDGIKNFQCNLCQRLYGSKAILQNHFDVVHNKELSTDLFTYLNDEEAKENEHFNNKKSKRRRVNDPTKVICPKGCGGWYRKLGLRAHLRICDSKPIKSKIVCPNNCSRMITTHGLRRHLNNCPGKLPEIGATNFKKFHYKTGYI